MDPIVVDYEWVRFFNEIVPNSFLTHPRAVMGYAILMSQMDLHRFSDDAKSETCVRFADELKIIASEAEMRTDVTLAGDDTQTPSDDAWDGNDDTVDGGMFNDMFGGMFDGELFDD